MPRRWNEYLVIRRSRIFDPAYYLLHYPDCRRSDIDPIWHYINYGWKEGRNPSSTFYTEYYLKMNPDVNQAGINPFVHYIKHGWHEGRSANPDRTRQPFGAQVTAKFIRLKRFRSDIYQIGKKVYWSIPNKYRRRILDWVFQNLGFLFRGIPHYANWLNAQALGGTNTNNYHNLINMIEVQPAQNAGGSIAIHIHIFYLDLIKEFINYLKNMPFPYDLYLSVPHHEDVDIYQRAFAGLRYCRKITIKNVINRGRDLSPFFCTFGKDLEGYDYIAHVHTKKSLYNKGATEGWREYLCNNLFGSEERIRRIFTLMQGKQPCGIVYPQNYIQVPTWANTWLANRSLGEIWSARLGFSNIPRGYFDFPVSSMFWARGDALSPLFKAGIVPDDFPEELGQTDGTLSHCLERLFALCSQKQGLPPGIIKDIENPSWSPWRFDRYTNRSYESMVHQFSSTNVKLIAFDIFDTLLCRPLLNPETIKKIVSRQVKGEAGHLYNEYRAISEQQARISIGMDVGLDEIFNRLGKQTGLSESDLAEIKHIEEEVEKASLEPRWEALRIFRAALATGKPVALVTDMFLSRSVIETCLRLNNIDGWDSLFVSNEVGLRKDSGELYQQVLAHYAIGPEEMLMVGDNERSDIQIPCDMGASFLHLLKPVELARGLPRFSGLIASHEQNGNVDAEITLGLVVRKNFSPIHYPTFDPDSLVQVTPSNLGYSLVGPLLVNFAQWLLQKSREDGIERLYFLSREGKLIKQVYDCWSEGQKNAPKSDYLVISRRVAGVAAILTLDDILDIARTIYYPNTIENFLLTRYGLSLSNERWGELAQAEGFDRTTEISVQGKKIEHLVPLLQASKTEIFAKAQNEKSALLRQLAEKGLNFDDRQAVVDIGYGGSVQGYMNKLLSQKVHGYYMITDERAEKVTRAYNVIIRGCFHENVSSASVAPLMSRYSFELEKLLSSDEPQIEYYEIDASGNVIGHYRDLLKEEIECAEIRRQVQEGAMNYAADARRIREKMLPDFQPSCWTAQMLMDAFLTQRSQREIDLLSKIVLDDHYCGRGLVS